MRRLLLTKISLLLILLTLGGLYASEIDADRLLFDSIISRNLDVEGVKKALREGADPNCIWEKNHNLSALSLLSFLSCSGGDREKERKCIQIALLLFNAGAKLQNIYGDRSILYTPIASGLYDFTELLLKNGASATQKIDGELPIEIAEKHGRSEIADLLVKYGAKPVGKDKSIQLRFIECASNSDVRCMKEYLQKGARVNGKDSQNVTALIAALRNPVYKIDQLMTVRFLLQQGADPNLQGNSKFKGLSGIPLHIAIAMNIYTMKSKSNLAELVIKELINAGAYVSGRDEMWRTPLHIAAQYNNYKGAQILIDSGAKIMDRDKEGRTPLDYAESAEMIKLLRQHGAR